MKKRRKARLAVSAGFLAVALLLASCGEEESAAPAEEPTLQPTAGVTEATQTARFRIDAPYLSQVDDYPSGCESVTAVMALNHAGYGIDVDSFIEDYLPLSEEPYYDDDGILRAGSPYEVFIGTPYSEFSYGCYAPVIRRALSAALDDLQGGTVPDGQEVNAEPTDGQPRDRVIDLSGKTLRKLCEEYVSRGIPVIVWGTIHMDPVESLTSWILPNGSEFTWKAHEHCMLLVGYDEDSYYFNDPLERKNVAYDRADCESAYAELYSQALAIVRE